MTLTQAQERVKHTLDQAWEDLAVPTVVHVAAPAYRGKTHVVQTFYEGLHRGAAAPTAESAVPTPLPSWQADGGWRINRKRITAPPLTNDSAARSLWFGVTATPGITDVLLPLRQHVEEVLTHCDQGSLPSATLEAIKPALASELGRVAAVATGKLALDLIPFYSSAETLASGLAKASQLWRRDSRSSEVLRDAVERPPAQEAVAMLALIRLLSPLDQAPALPLTILVIEDAQSLRDREFQLLTELLTVNPDDVLAQQLLPPQVYRPLRALGVPPRLPILTVLLETTTSGDDPFLGPMGELHQREAREERVCDPWMNRWSSAGVETFRSINELPLFTQDEARDVVDRLCPNVSEQAQRIIVDRAKDGFLDGYNPALLQSHVERVSTLINADQTVTPSWAERELPNHLRVELQQVADRLAHEAKTAVAAGALLGHGFAGRSVNETLDRDAAESLASAGRLGVLHPDPQVGDTYYTFDNSMTQGYFYELGSGDEELSWRVLDRHAASKARWLIRLAPPFHTEEARAMSSLARQALWEFRSLIYDAGLIDRAGTHRDVWLASLTLGADLDIIKAETGDQLAKDRLRWLWEEGDDVGPQEGEDPSCWSVTGRWLAHRLTPGAMTPGTLFSSAKAGSLPSSVTRTLPAAHEKASDRMSRLLSMHESNFFPGWVDVQYAARLGPFCRLLEQPSRRHLAEALLRVAPVSMTATNLLVGDLRQELSTAERARALALLTGWTRVADGRDQLKAIAVLGSSAPSAIPPDLLKLGMQAIKEGTSDDPFSDFEISGSVVDGSAPTNYPWYGLPILVCQMLLTATDAQMSRSDLDLISRALWRDAAKHPSAVALLELHFTEGMSRRRRRDLRRLKETWSATRLVGSCEQAGLLVLSHEA